MSRPSTSTSPRKLSKAERKASKKQEKLDEQLKKESVKYHEGPVPGKFIMVPTKKLNNHNDLAVSNGPGVAEPCKAIARD